MPKPDPAEIIRVELIEHAEPDDEWTQGSPGVYRWMHRQDDYRLSERDLKKDLAAIMPDMVDAILTRLFNFRVVFINKRTGEVFT
jgi:hypothetical protein